MIGSKRDAKQRISLIRIDSEDRQQKVELARKLMFEGGVNITSERIEKLLRPTSLIPTRVCFPCAYDTRSHSIVTQNAFSERLFIHGFNFYQMFVPDLLHEFELGVWKAVFTHLIRILYSCGENKIQTLNSR